jgi:tRNA nucleotidyltransferase/poly(A) polymerase
MNDDYSKCTALLNDPYNHIVFNSINDDEMYIVGGYIRDVFLGKDVMDRDYVVKKDFKRAAERVATKTGGRIVQIGKSMLCRVIVKDGTCMDFTQMNENIENDLSRRDFTVNALAWSPATGLIDLFKGIKDIKKGLIRVVRKENLSIDAVRLIRAYRLSGETLFDIDRDTRLMIREMVHKIDEVKTERITLEFFKILNLYDPVRVLKMMLEDNILARLIFMPTSQLQLILNNLDEVNRIINQNTFKNLLEPSNVYSQSLSYKGLLRLELLLKESGGNLLRLSRRIRRRLLIIGKACRIMQKDHFESKERLYLFFKVAGDAAFDFLVINNLLKYLSDLERFENIQRNGLLSTNEIMDILGISEGVILGRVKEFIRKAEFSREIKGHTEAVDLLRNNIESFVI